MNTYKKKILSMITLKRKCLISSSSLTAPEVMKMTTSQTEVVSVNCVPNTLSVEVFIAVFAWLGMRLSYWINILSSQRAYCRLLLHGFRQFSTPSPTDTTVVHTEQVLNINVYMASSWIVILNSYVN